MHSDALIRERGLVHNHVPLQCVKHKSEQNSAKGIWGTQDACSLRLQD
jgi:hypothetical protein